MRRTKEESEQTREAIFDAGLQVFSEKGFTAATMSDIARKAGVTRGAIYWHFKNKEAFFEEIVSQSCSYYDELQEEAVKSDLPMLESLHRAITTMLSRFFSDRRWRMMQEFILRESLTTQASSEELNDLASGRGITLLQEAIEKGQIFSRWSASTAQLSLHALIVGVFLESSYQGTTLSREEIGHIADFIVRGFAPSPSHSARSIHEKA
ncbi:hypothetical protein AU468_10095 [Alkalispirochaeta sphaeroplastigenens]|uniref:HTH tetR-type domain-containing protein n=1 Tax=Alkalispirochaeta sphaeroplastigenens TaxID=1187066 RepID=A0A2S4JJD0_9SPIO|nr:TetR family transcriptional regulator [Alkalispirochaeta sphaeroplastigenens]POQ99652.1 hypothetical protein AU468_10095 [Alkalispirochaeta sphaeroplastigenens]